MNPNEEKKHHRTRKKEEEEKVERRKQKRDIPGNTRGSFLFFGCLVLVLVLVESGKRSGTKRFEEEKEEASRDTL